VELEMVTGQGRPMLKSDECPDRTFRAGAELVWGCGGAEVWRCGIRIGTEVRSGGAEVRRCGVEVRRCGVEERRCGGVAKKGQRCVELEFHGFGMHRGEGIRISEVQSGGGMRVRVLE